MGFEGSYFRLRSVLFSLRFLHRFLVAFWTDLGAILGAFGEPKWIILGIVFLLNFACRSKTALRPHKSGPRAAKSRPRGAQEAPRGPMRRRKGLQGHPKGTQEHPKGAQESPKGTQESEERQREAERPVWLNLKRKICVFPLF